MVQAHVGPPSENQAVTSALVAAFSFALNTNLNTTPRQLHFSHFCRPLCSCFCVQIIASNQYYPSQFSFHQPLLYILV